MRARRRSLSAVRRSPGGEVAQESQESAHRRPAPRRRRAPETLATRRSDPAVLSAAVARLAARSAGAPAHGSPARAGERAVRCDRARAVVHRGGPWSTVVSLEWAVREAVNGRRLAVVNRGGGRRRRRGRLRFALCGLLRARTCCSRSRSHSVDLRPPVAWVDGHAGASVGASCGGRRGSANRASRPSSCVSLHVSHRGEAMPHIAFTHRTPVLDPPSHRCLLSRNCALRAADAHRLQRPRARLLDDAVRLLAAEALEQQVGGREVAGRAPPAADAAVDPQQLDRSLRVAQAR